MEKECPPDPGNRDLDMSPTEDKINAYDAVATSYQAGIQPAVFFNALISAGSLYSPGRRSSDDELGSDSRPVHSD